MPDKDFNLIESLGVHIRHPMIRSLSAVTASAYALAHILPMTGRYCVGIRGRFWYDGLRLPPTSPVPTGSGI